MRHLPVRLLVLLLCLGSMTATGTGTGARVPDTPAVSTTLIAPKFHLISDGRANLLLLLGEDSAFAAGVQAPALVEAAAAIAARNGGRTVKYALAADDDRATEFGDGGWGGRGAVTLVQELLFARMKRRGGALPVLPIMSFSQVVQLRFADEDTHIIHERAGYTDADIIVHYEDSGVLYLGHTFTSDGYPRIDVARGGQVAGLMQTIDFFVLGFARNPAMLEPIVPGRGPVATYRDLQDYREMLIAVRDRVKSMIDLGRTLDEIVAAHPTDGFDARWGRGPVTPDAFVTSVHASLVKAQSGKR